MSLRMTLSDLTVSRVDAPAPAAARGAGRFNAGQCIHHVPIGAMRHDSAATPKTTASDFQPVSQALPPAQREQEGRGCASGRRVPAPSAR